MSVRASNACAAATATKGRKFSPKKVGVLALVAVVVVGSGLAYYLTRPVAKDPVSFRVGDLDDEFAVRGARDALKGKSRDDLKKEFNKFKADTDKKIKKDTIITKGTKKVVEAPQAPKDQFPFLDLGRDALQVASEKEKTFEAVKKELSEPNADLERNFKRFMAQEEAKKAAAKKAAAEKAAAQKDALVKEFELDVHPEWKEVDRLARIFSAFDDASFEEQDFLSTENEFDTLEEARKSPEFLKFSATVEQLNAFNTNLNGFRGPAQKEAYEADKAAAAKAEEEKKAAEAKAEEEKKAAAAKAEEEKNAAEAKAEEKKAAEAKKAN